MKAKNEVAEKFQAKVADEIIPSIRKTGGYGIRTVDDMINDPDTAMWCLADTGNAIGSSRSGSLLGLLHRRERDSRFFTNDEIIFDNFGSKNPLPLNNRGQVFVSLSGFLEILSKTELSSDKESFIVAPTP